MILDLLSQKVTERELLDDYPDLEPEGIRAGLAYAKTVVANEDVEYLGRQGARFRDIIKR